MKTSLKNAVKATVIAAALACSSLAHAAETFNQNPVDGGAIFDGNAKFFKDQPQFMVDATQYEMSSNSDFSKKFFVYCIAPGVETLHDAVYTMGGAVQVSDAVKILYETAYQATLGPNKGAEQLAFQLALWELHNDNSDLYSGQMAFSASSAEQLAAAQALLDNVRTGTVQNLYRYVAFDGKLGDQVSQQMMGVMPVPEVETWAMLLVGLGLVGMVGLKSRGRDALVGDEKFS